MERDRKRKELLDALKAKREGEETPKTEKEEFAEEVNKKFIFVKIDFKDTQVIQDSKLLEHH